jgi:hypothetical protein
MRTELADYTRPTQIDTRAVRSVQNSNKSGGCFERLGRMWLELHYHEQLLMMMARRGFRHVDRTAKIFNQVINAPLGTVSMNGKPIHRSPY